MYALGARIDSRAHRAADRGGCGASARKLTFPAGFIDGRCSGGN